MTLHLGWSFTFTGLAIVQFWRAWRAR